MQAAAALALGMKRLRRRLGMTQEALAEAADLHVQYVSQVERMKRSPSMETIDLLAAALGVTPAQLFIAGESPDSSRQAEVTERVSALLDGWSGKDQEHLVRVLLELRQIAGAPRGARRRRSRSAK
jgi:transcriptional regulator with XRE-family HTH domain